MGLALLAMTGCVSPRAPTQPPGDAGSATYHGVPAGEAAALAEQWGIKVESLRLSARGRILDFRYRVLDPGKAAALADEKKEAVLIDEATGRRLKVPAMPKVGPLRSATSRPEKGRIYIILFANPGAQVTTGSRVSVEIGDFTARCLAVE